MLPLCGGNIIVFINQGQLLHFSRKNFLLTFYALIFGEWFCFTFRGIDPFLELIQRYPGNVA